MLQIKKALPRLQIFNSRPVDKDAKNDKGHMVDGQNEGDHLETADDLNLGSKSSKKRKKTIDVSEKDVGVIDEENTGHNKANTSRKKDKLIGIVDSDMKNKSTKKKLRKDDKTLDKENVNRIEKKMKKKQKNEKQSEFDVIDDAEASFEELFNMKEKDAENLNHGGEMEVQDELPKGLKMVGSTETASAKHQSAKVKNMESLSSPVAEIGMGGPSTWGDD